MKFVLIDSKDNKLNQQMNNYKNDDILDYMNQINKKKNQTKQFHVFNKNSKSTNFIKKGNEEDNRNNNEMQFDLYDNTDEYVEIDASDDVYKLLDKNSNDMWNEKSIKDKINKDEDYNNTKAGTTRNPINDRPQWNYHNQLEERINEVISQNKQEGGKNSPKTQVLNISKIGQRQNSGSKQMRTTLDNIQLYDEALSR